MRFLCSFQFLNTSGRYICWIDMLLLSVHFAPHLPMHSAAFEAKYIAKGNGRPLRILHSAITAGGVARQSLDNGLVGRSHLHHPGSKYGILPRRFSTNAGVVVAVDVSSRSSVGFEKALQAQQSAHRDTQVARQDCRLQLNDS